MREHELINLIGLHLALLVVALGLAIPADAATKIFVHDATSKLGTTATAGTATGCGNGAVNAVFRLANATQGTAAVTKTFTPAATAPPCRIQSSNAGDMLIWVTPPLSSGVTVSGNINAQGYCRESANVSNFGFRVVVYRWDRTRGGISSTVFTSGNSSSECGTTAAVRTIAAAAPTSTTFATGDRIVITFEMAAVGGAWGGNGARTSDFVYDGLTGASGDTWVNFTETISFSADLVPMPTRVF